MNAIALPHLVTGLKFQARMNCARLLGTLLTAGLETAGGELPEVIIPVPLHPTRLRERGFNQALEIARIPARHFGLPIDTHHCRRQFATEPQSGLEAKERRRNIRGAFAVADGLASRYVVLLDDVVTTKLNTPQVFPVCANRPNFLRKCRRFEQEPVRWLSGTSLSGRCFLPPYKKTAYISAKQIYTSSPHRYQVFGALPRQVPIRPLGQQGNGVSGASRGLLRGVTCWGSTLQQEERINVLLTLRGAWLTSGERPVSVALLSKGNDRRTDWILLLAAGRWASGSGSNRSLADIPRRVTSLLVAQ